MIWKLDAICLNDRSRCLALATFGRLRWRGPYFIAVLTFQLAVKLSSLEDHQTSGLHCSTDMTEIAKKLNFSFVAKTREMPSHSNTFTSHCNTEMISGMQSARWNVQNLLIYHGEPNFIGAARLQKFITMVLIRHANLRNTSMRECLSKRVHITSFVSKRRPLCGHTCPENVNQFFLR